MNIAEAQRCGQSPSHSPDIHVWVPLSSTQETKPLSGCSPLYSHLTLNPELQSLFDYREKL